MQKKKFKELYEHCQTLSPKVKRNQIIDKVKEITGQKIRTMKTTLDTTVVRGYFLSAANLDHPFVKMHGCNVIVLARGMNDCWERFVNTKEAMHLLDCADDSTDSKEKFEKLLNDLVTPSIEPAPQRDSDRTAVWMALACLCPEKDRIEFELLRNKGQLDDYGIALRLKIPTLYVPFLFMASYKRLIVELLSE